MAKSDKKPEENTQKNHRNRREVLALGASASATIALSSSIAASAAEQLTRMEKIMSPKAFVYTEIPVAASFDDIPWGAVNNKIKPLSGFLNKTWLSGVGDNSAGGFYAFDSIENAQKFVTGYFPQEASGFGVTQSTKVFDASATEEASRDMNSMHFGGKIDAVPEAFVYTEVQLSGLPFNEAIPWKTLNPILKQQTGILAKTWTSGLHTGTPGGFYAFDSKENAIKFALEYFPKEAAGLNAAFTTKIFDAKATEAASRAMNSPFYS